jgi:hypothetical protein
MYITEKNVPWRNVPVYVPSALDFRQGFTKLHPICGDGCGGKDVIVIKPALESAAFTPLEELSVNIRSTYAMLTHQ